MRRGLVLGAFAALVLALPATAAPPITCGRVASAKGLLIVRTHGPTCSYAKKWIKTYVARRAAPKGWTCRAYGADLPAHCVKKGRKTWYFLAGPVA